MKYKHTDESIHVLNDLENRLKQLIEVSKVTGGNGFEGSQYEVQAFESCLTLVDQIRTTGHVFRGNEYFPDALPTTIPSYHNPLKVEHE